MPSKAVILWRICDWYLTKSPAISPDQLFEVFRAVTKSLAIPNVGYHHVGQNYFDGVMTPKQEQVAAMFRHLAGTLQGSALDDCTFSFVWSGHKAEFPKIFDAEMIKEDEKEKKARDKWLTKKKIHATEPG